MTQQAEVKVADQGQGEALVALEGVEYGYAPGRPIVKGLSGAVRAGKLTALIGPNAAGKSTLLKLMLGQARPWRGSVKLGGSEVWSMGAAERARLISYVPQRAGVGFAFSVEQVVGMGRFAQGAGIAADRAAAEGALEACDLTGLRERVFSELSFGQQQRVLLARALAQARGRGRLMLLDEPGSAMDLWHVHHMMGWLVRLARSGLGVVVVLHDLNLASRYADEVWLMDQGGLVAAGSWGEVLRPGLLEPVYRVGLKVALVEGEGAGHGGRPVFCVEPREGSDDRLE